MAHSGYVFAVPVSGNRRDPSGATKAIRRVLDKAGCPWATSHTFRHTMITRMHDDGVPTARISDRAGHSDFAFTLRRYVTRHDVATVGLEAL